MTNTRCRAVAVGARGVVAWELMRGRANSQSFAAFVTSLPHARDGGPRHVLMDNVAFHKTTLVRDALARRGLQALFTPPYSPEFNPVEMAFSACKARMRSTSATCTRRLCCVGRRCQPPCGFAAAGQGRSVLERPAGLHPAEARGASPWPMTLTPPAHFSVRPSV